MTKPSLFDDNERYTEEALDIEGELSDAISEIIEKYKDTYRIRELQLLGVNAVYNVSLGELL